MHMLYWSTDISLPDKKLKPAVLHPDGKCIMWTGSHDLNEYSNTNFLSEYQSSYQVLKYFQYLYQP